MHQATYKYECLKDCFVNKTRYYKGQLVDKFNGVEDDKKFKKVSEKDRVEDKTFTLSDITPKPFVFASSLADKTIDEIRSIANERGVKYSGRTSKETLIGKILNLNGG